MKQVPVAEGGILNQEGDVRRRYDDDTLPSFEVYMFVLFFFI